MSARLLSISFFSRDKVSLLNLLVRRVAFGKALCTVATPNAEQIVQAAQDPQFTQTLSEFEIRIPDGSGPVLASKLLGWWRGSEKLTEWIPGVDVVAGLLDEFADDPKITALVIGGREYNGLSYKKWQVKNARSAESPVSPADKKPLYWLEGYQSVSAQTPEETTEILKSIKKLKPQIVFVAFGAPSQETWIIQNREFLDKNGVRVAMVVGGAFDMLLGKLTRAPQWLRSAGFEWLYRLYQQPWRWHRQLRLITFLWLVLKHEVFGFPIRG